MLVLFVSRFQWWQDVLGHKLQARLRWIGRSSAENKSLINPSVLNDDHRVLTQNGKVEMDWKTPELVVFVSLSMVAGCLQPQSSGSTRVDRSDSDRT